MASYITASRMSNTSTTVALRVEPRMSLHLYSGQPQYLSDLPGSHLMALHATVALHLQRMHAAAVLLKRGMLA